MSHATAQTQEQVRERLERAIDSRDWVSITYLDRAFTVEPLSLSGSMLAAYQGGRHRHEHRMYRLDFISEVAILPYPPEDDTDN
jgi:DNA-binding GntR family transcriptional regulator